MASSRNVFWHRTMKWNMEENFRMEFGMEENCGVDYGKTAFHFVPFHTMLYLCEIRQDYIFIIQTNKPNSASKYIFFRKNTAEAW